ncbi:MAG: ABC transporter ATP-binding protein [Novosphingobium sp.]
MIEPGNEMPVLAPLTHSFESDRFHVVGGPSGAGKTTLLSILSLTVKAHRGMVQWGDQNLTALPAAAQALWRRDHLGMVFQTSRLVSVMTAFEHVYLAAAIRRREDAVERGTEMLASLGMADKRHHLPSQLSGGEKQRVAIAQALCAEPRVLLADEPTAALDARNAELVAYTLRTYARTSGAVVICVSHDRVVIDAADDLLMLDRPQGDI